MTEEPFPLFLMIFSGACWTLVYLDGIRLGLRDRTYAIPFCALALNLAWELLNAVIEFRESGLVTQVWISSIWLLLDLGILYTFLRYGRREFPERLPSSWFLPWTLLAIAVALVLQLAFILEFGFLVGRAYAAFLQNLLMSVLFIGMLVRRGHRGGQSLTIAVSKWLGTLAPTILFGVLGTSTFEGPSSFILIIGLFCALFDLIYIWMLAQTQLWPRPATNSR
ncbi:MAG: hypothetical protein N838_24615 [Thiohalocapsa sp. PB-PSB1]|jgi:hypothetical protein|nr:MAG: hypothetical protein N838_20165 [Thiohalocapsa sp. PB-PSB1]QQO56061.1 MAG: hypothetical protein N838_24615 [Thiohalocapsa sp. PB-PSB1]HCS91826.1 hypothetical protein [Chromatiaceae bacterium]